MVLRAGLLIALIVVLRLAWLIVLLMLRAAALMLRLLLLVVARLLIRLGFARQIRLRLVALRVRLVLALQWLIVVAGSPTVRTPDGACLRRAAG